MWDYLTGRSIIYVHVYSVCPDKEEDGRGATPLHASVIQSTADTAPGVTPYAHQIIQEITNLHAITIITIVHIPCRASCTILLVELINGTIN